MVENPFPRNFNGRIIENEECYCGAMRTEHSPGPAGAFGHGACLRTKCKQFTWKRMVIAESPKAVK
jgi:hypothetical protein